MKDAVAYLMDLAANPTGRNPTATAEHVSEAAAEITTLRAQLSTAQATIKALEGELTETRFARDLAASRLFTALQVTHDLRQRAIAVCEELYEACNRIVQDHTAPDDCWAMGPHTGNRFADYEACPGCVAVAELARAADFIAAERGRS